MYIDISIHAHVCFHMYIFTRTHTYVCICVSTRVNVMSQQGGLLANLTDYKHSSVLPHIE